MEVHDFEKEHLEAVLKDEDQPKDDGHDGGESATPTFAMTFNSASDLRPRLSLPSSKPSITDNDDCQQLHFSTSRQRYELLPDYAQESFVSTGTGTNDDSPFNAEGGGTALFIQDTRQDLEGNLPRDIKTPSTKRARDIVRMTAVKCVSAPQLEVLLKVKQTDNPDFAFLDPTNDCHSYYLWLKAEHERTKKEKETMARAGGLGLLEMYSSSSSSDDEESTTGSSERKNAELEYLQTRTVTDIKEDAQEGAPAVSLPVSGESAKRQCDHHSTTIESDTADAEKKARRLKRAKLMRGHYRLQLMEGGPNGGSNSSTT